MRGTLLAPEIAQPTGRKVQAKAGAMTTDTRIDLQDPRWIPLRYEASRDTFHFGFVEADTLGSASFMDARMGEPWHRTTTLPSDAIGPDRPASSPAWLFHSAFCGSTLLARAIHSPPGVMALKEPHVLFDLTQLSLVEDEDLQDLLARRLETAVGLLGRPWDPGGRVLVKPTNVANRLIPSLLSLSPDSRAVLLFGSLEEFLISCAKKLPSAQTAMQWMVHYLLPGTRLECRLEIPKDHEFNFMEACVLTWYAQMEMYADALNGDTGDRLRSLDTHTLLQEPGPAVAAAVSWLGFDQAWAPHAGKMHVEDVFARDSKRTDTAYGPAKRSSEKTAVLARYGDLIRAGLDWADRSITPLALLPQDWKPLRRGTGSAAQG